MAVFREVYADIDGKNPADCLRTLAALEKEVRCRLSAENVSLDLSLLEVGRNLVSSESTIGAELRVEILVHIVQWAYQESEIEAAMPLAHKALSIATNSKTPILERRALTHMGLLHLAQHNFADATICFARALEIANAIGDRTSKCATLANLAAVRLEAGLIDESIKLNNYVLELTIGESHLRGISTDAHCNIAQASMYVGDLSTALEHAEKAVCCLQEPASQFSGSTRVVMELILAKVFIKAGQLDRAKSHVECAAHYSEKAASRNAKIHAELARALYEAATNQVDIALTRVSGMRQIVEMNEPLFRDILEVELLCKEYTGQENFTRYYNKKYLSSLSHFQRVLANSQIASIKRAIRGSSRMTWSKQIEGLATLAELRDEPTGRHSLRVSQISRLIGQEMGYTKNELAKLEFASRLHDIGKLAIPDAILLKRSRLSRVEGELMRRHTVEGCQMLADLVLTLEESSKARDEVELLRAAADVALHHHEYWNGSGYPRRLQGTAIPEAARIVAVADAFEELTYGRPYKPAIPTARAIELIQTAAGQQFDATICALLPKATASLSSECLQEVHDDSFMAANRVVERIVSGLPSGEVQPHVGIVKAAAADLPR